MIVSIEFPMIGPSADRFTRFTRRLRAGQTRRMSMATFAILVLTMLCAFGPALRAQTAVYDGVTETAYPASGTSSLTNPTGIAMDSSGDLFVADSGNGYLTGDTKYTSIWELTSTGLRTFNAPTQIVAGTAAATGKYAYIMGVAVDPSGNVWFTDIGCKSTTIITCTNTGLSTIGGAVWELPKTSTGYGTAVSITLSSGSWGTPWGITVDKNGNVFVADNANQKIYEIPAGETTATALTGTVPYPRRLTADASSNLYVVSATSPTSPSGSLYKLTEPGYASSTLGTVAFSSSPDGITIDSAGNLWVTENGTGTLVEVLATGYTTSQVWVPGDLTKPNDVVGDSLGDYYLADSGSDSIREAFTNGADFGWTAVGSPTTETVHFLFNGAASTTIGAPVVFTQGATALDFTNAGTGTCAAGANAAGSNCSVTVKFAPTTPGTRIGAVQLLNAGGTAVIATGKVWGIGTGPQLVFTSDTTPSKITTTTGTLAGLAVDGAGDVFFSDSTLTHVNEFVAATSTVSTVGSGFSSPQGLAVDGAGNVFVADSGNSAVKEIVAVNGKIPTTPTINTVGSGFKNPTSVSADGAGNVFVADSGNNAVKEIVAVNGQVSSTSTVNTVGSGFSNPTSVWADDRDDLFIADKGNNAVKLIVSVNSLLSSSSQVVDQGAGFSSPTGAVIDSGGDVFVADTGNQAVKEIVEVAGDVSTTSTVLTLASSTTTTGLSPAAVALNAGGDVFVADSGNKTVWKLPLSTPPTITFPTSTQVSTTDTVDGPLSATIANHGNTDNLGFPLPTTGTNPSVSTNFAWDNSSTCVQTTSSSTTAFTMNRGAYCTIAVDFEPAATGAITGSVVLTDDSLYVTGTQTISLKGTGINIAISCAMCSPSTTLPAGTVGTAYSGVTFTATGGTGTGYTWSATGLPAGLSLSTTGVLSGTPTAAATSASVTVTATVTPAGGGYVSKDYTITINQPVTATQSIPSTSLTQNHAATSFTPVTGGGGATPLSYGVSPTLPAGLTMSSSTGAITGTPSAVSSTTSYTVTVTDANSAKATASFSLTVNAAVTATQSIASTTLTQNHAVASFTPVTGGSGTSPLSYGVSPALPAGLTMSSSTGAVTGTPTAVSSATSYTVTVTDANGATATASFSLTVNTAVTATQSIASTTLTENSAAASFTPVTGGGGTPPLSYSVTPSLPAGLTMSSSTGAITGTPTVVSSATSYTVTVTDANGATATAGFSLTVVAPIATTYTMSAGTTSRVSPGSSAKSTITVTGSGGYAGSISLTCTPSSSNPTNQSGDAPTCSISGSPITLSATTTSGTATATVTTAAASTSDLVYPKVGNGKGWLGAGSGAVLALLFFFGIPARRRSWRSMVSIVVALVVLGALASCGGGGGGSSSQSTTPTNPGTTAGTYTFTITSTTTGSAVTPAPTSTFTVTVN